MLRRYQPSIYFIILLFLAVLIYFPGLKGDFIFDDFYNLQNLGVFGPINNWESAKNFIFSGNSGPTGRPIALASFLIDGNNWPTNPEPFKITNLWIHLICGTLLYWTILSLLDSYKYPKNFTQLEINWTASISAGIWLLHPFMVSTTLYVVQRMAQLSTMFSLVGILGYLYGRKKLSSSNLKAYMVMTLSIGLGSLLAFYSKENGALLPLLILIIEFCNPEKRYKPVWQWRLICLWIPSIITIILILSYIDFSINPWPNRSFNQIERLLTESRIVCDYLISLFIPKIEGNGLFQDGYIVSKSLLMPWSTLISIIFILTLFTVSFLFRKKYPLVALSFIFFFGAHLMESTIIGLELYFEHRNYLASIFLFVPIAHGLVLLNHKIKISLVVLITVLIMSMLSWMTWQRSTLWGNSVKLELYWAYNSLNSARAQVVIADKLMQQKRFDEAQAQLEKAQIRLPNSGLLSIFWLLTKVRSHEATEQDFLTTSEKLATQPFDTQVTVILREIIENNIVINKELSEKYGDYVNYLIDAISNNPSYKQYPINIRLMHYLKAKIFLSQSQPQLAYIEYSKALYLYNDTEVGLEMTQELYNKGYYKYALSLLNETDSVYIHQDEKTLKRSHKEYELRLQKLRSDLHNMLKVINY